MKVAGNFRIMIALGMLVFLLQSSSCALFKSEEEDTYEDLRFQELIDGTLVRYSLAVPNAYSPQSPTPLILALHFGGQRTLFYGEDFVNLLVKPALRDLEAIIVAPTCPWTSGWDNSASENVIIALLDTVKTYFNIDTDRVLVTGYSMGAIGTWYFAARYPDTFAVAIPVSGMPSSSDLDGLGDIPLYVIHSKSDEIFDWQEVRQVILDLQADGKNVHLELVSGLSHYETEKFVGPLHGSIPWVRANWGK